MNQLPIHSNWKKKLIFIFFAFILTNNALGSPASENPQRPFLSSIPYLFLRPHNYQPHEEKITFYPERSSKIPFKDRNRISYTYLLQKNQKAPVIFVIPGVGGTATSLSILAIAELAYEQGFSVVTLPSSTHWSFALAASETGRPGFLPDDSKDMLRLMSYIKGSLEQQYHIRPSQWGLMGVSYGGLDSAFVMDRDSEVRNFNFNFLFMINPPFNHSAITVKTDRYYKYGDKWTAEYRQYLSDFAVSRAVDIANRTVKINSYKNLAEAFPFTENELAWMIAHEFRRAILNTAYVGNLLEGIPTPSANEAFQGSISDYLKQKVYPLKINSLHNNLEQLELKNEFLYTLKNSHGNLIKTKKIVMVHSMNDFLSFPEGFLILNSLPFETHMIPYGGHLGFMDDEPAREIVKNQLKQLFVLH